MRPQRADRGLERGAADVVEVDVDPVAEQLARIRVVVVEGDVEAELLEPGHLLGRAGAPDHAAALQLRDLAHDRTDGARGARDEDRLPLLRPADLEQAVSRR